MKKLLLASFAVYTLDLVLPLLTKPATETTVVYITTAADPYLDKTFVSFDRAKLVSMGFRIIDVDLKQTQGAALETILTATDMIFVAGGNTFYLLDWARKSGFVELAKKAVAAGKIYVGSSAGAVICCPDIWYIRALDDPGQAPDLAGDFTGLNLIPSAIIPHAHKEKYSDRIAAAQQELEAQQHPSVALTDEQALVVTDTGSEIITLTKPLRRGACAILRNTQGKILLGQRKNSYKAGLFGLPGGRVELNEFLTTSIAREVTEETGLENLSYRFVGAIRENQGDYDFTHFVFAAEIGNQQPQLCEPEKCAGWEWFDAGTLPETLHGHLSGIALYLEQSQ